MSANPHHILPDADAPRHSWNFVKHIAAKASAAAWKEAAEVARTYAIIAGTTRQEQITSADNIAQEFARLARVSEQRVNSSPASAKDTPEEDQEPDWGLVYGGGTET